jgi:hypothetical protein
MFVNYLRESDDPAFDRMMNAVLDGRAFAEAVTVGYHDDVRSLWQRQLDHRLGDPAPNRLWFRVAGAPNWSAKRKREPQFNAESK